jgi:hypothetical protein
MYLERWNHATKHKRGFTPDISGFATVETEPKNKAPIIAEI